MHKIIEMNGKKVSKTLTQEQVNAVMSAWSSCIIFEDARAFRYLFNEDGKLVADYRYDGNNAAVGQMRVFSDESVKKALDQKAYQDKVIEAHRATAEEKAAEGLHAYFGEWLTPEEIEAKRNEIA